LQTSQIVEVVRVRRFEPELLEYREKVSEGADRLEWW
jgi:hypothetical protein